MSALVIADIDARAGGNFPERYDGRYDCPTMPLPYLPEPLEFSSAFTVHHGCDTEFA